MESEARQQRGQRGALALLALIVGACLAGAAWDVDRRRDARLREELQSLQHLGRLAQSLARADETRSTSDLQRLRAELRRGDLWIRGAERSFPADTGAQGEQEEPSAAPGDALDEGVDEERESAGGSRRQDADRRLASTLRRSLQASEAILGFDVIVAGEEGLRLRSIGRAPKRDALGSGQPRNQAKALWYAEDVRRAVTGSAERVERGSLLWEQGSEGRAPHAVFRLSIALHEPGDLVQGALVARVDPSRLAREIGALGLQDRSVELRTVRGRSLLDPDTRLDATDVQAVDWIARMLEQPESPVELESGGRLGVGALLESAQGDPTDLVWLAHAASPGALSVAWASAWPIALLGLLGTSTLAGWALRASAAQSGPRAPESPQRALVRSPETGPESAAEGSAEDAHTRVDEQVDRHGDLAPSAETGQERRGAGSDGSSRDRADEPGRVDGGSDRGRVGEAGEADRTGPTEGDGADGPHAPPIAHEIFVLRDWLADVRSCLERDAARRGLRLEMRCARSLPKQLESDPVALGGLLVALGRDALDATADEQVAIEVLEGAQATLRFEIRGGSSALTPLPGLEAVAVDLGVAFDPTASEGVVLVL
ncbi:MAG: hypothetical protein ACX98W_08855 [bacterium]